MKKIAGLSLSLAENLQTSFSASPSIDAKLQSWLNSDFAGFRRILSPGSDCAPDFTELKYVAEKHRLGSSGKAIKNFVLFGTGGSSLGSETIIRALTGANHPIQFYFLDNNDASFLAPHFERWNPEETLFYVVSKSGNTPETIAQFLIAADWIQKKVKNWKQHFVFCTDPQKGDLRILVNSQGFSCLSVPPAVGGRFSVLTPVGFFPALFANLDAEKIWQGAKSWAEAVEKNSAEKNPAYQLAHALCQKKLPIHILMPYSSRLSAFSRWYCQLWAESLGKSQKGFTPYPAIGTVDQHSQVQLYMEGPKDKVIGLIRIASPSATLPLPSLAGCEQLNSFQLLREKSMQDLFEAEFLATRDAFAKENIPTFTLELDRLDEESLGALFYFWELTTAVAGAILDINPFDQPGVELAKKLTKEYLQRS